jgi:hypothetical protein
MSRFKLIVAFTMATVLVGSLPAQRRSQAPAQSGFWYGFGLAPGWARVSCGICAGDRPVGVSGVVRLGGGAGRRVLIGAELAGWHQRGGNVTQTLTAIGAAAYFYPGQRRALYFKGGVGLVTHRADDGVDVITSTGLGPQMGIGYEFGFGRKWTLAPFFNLATGILAGGVKFNGGQAVDQVNVSFFQLGVTLTRP